jgi:formylglycine-generating enzyme required for sulfatase activity
MKTIRTAALLLVFALSACLLTVSVAAVDQPPAETALDLGGGVSLKLALIPAGKFVMGSPTGEDVRRRDETQHEVTISKPFYMGIHLVTVNQFAAFVKDCGYKTDAEKEGWSRTVDIRDGRLAGGKGKNPNLAIIRADGVRSRGASWRDPGFDQKGDHPVVQVSWNDARAFCDWLTKKSGKAVALPTEAQWEYACRAGTKAAWPWGDNPDDGKGWANLADQSLKKRLPENGGGIKCFNWDDGFVFTSPVGSFKANGFGLFDMIGNAAHWCHDRYGDYEKGAVTDPTGADAGMDRVVRGGSWNNFGIKNCRSAARYHFPPDFRNERYGFRIVMK